jgi:hypothetical protein
MSEPPFEPARLRLARELKEWSQTDLGVARLGCLALFQAGSGCLALAGLIPPMRGGYGGRESVSGMGSLLQRLEEHEAAARDQVERLRAQIASLSARLTGEEETLSRLGITRQTVLSVLGDDDAGVAAPAAAAPDETVPVPTADRRVLDVFAAAGQPLRVKQVCQALEEGAEPRQVERTRHKLKRLVERGLLAEPHPGLFVTASAAGAAGPATMGEEDQ